MAKPHPKTHKKKNFNQENTVFDYAVYFFAFTTPLFELPQAFLIYSNHSAANVSKLTWFYFCLASTVFLIYAVKRHIRPLTIAYSMYLVIELAIVVGIIRYS